MYLGQISCKQKQLGKNQGQRWQILYLSRIGKEGNLGRAVTRIHGRQKPNTRSEQLPWIVSRRFYRPVYLTILVVSKTCRPKNYGCLVFFILWLNSRTEQLFTRIIALKINQSVKTPFHRPNMGVARSGLWARLLRKVHVNAPGNGLTVSE